MKLIVAVDRHWGIGKGNKLLFSLKTDMAFFKKTTTGKIVVMGKNTFLSFPGGPLKNRINVVLTKENFQGCICVKSMDELMRTISKYDTDEVYVIGGASMYRTMLPYCETALITKVDAVGDADTYFPNLDLDKNWELTQKTEAEDTFPIAFCEYKNKNLTEYIYEN